MNEAKPIVTCHGNQSLFSNLHSHVAQGLPKEACEWKRSFGRAARSVYLEASFVPYDADILPDEEEKTLVSRPYFHIFWTDCDLETYKQTVKDDINEWQTALKSRNIPDWLIVVVSSEESKVKAKLLPRASVIDKVKSDFCSKNPDRCIVLTEPNKLDSKTSESWTQLFQRLRTLLLQAFNRHLNRYEENMRSRREKRNEPGWNYFSYFIFQEELAFMFEMLGLKEDALIQYDELDAMFDQFVENFASGDTVKWLTPLMEPCSSWAGVSLVKSLDLDLRDQVKQNNASLLDFRNYLFSRQAALLFQMKRAWEVAMRAMEYLYNTVVEMKALEVDVPNGALSCWVFLSCLEILHACEEHNSSQFDGKFALHTANLWDYAHKKLRELGHLCSLMPGLVPSSEQLSLVVDLVSGMGLSEENLSPSHQQPVDKLRESLSSPDSFKKHYLHMCEQAMGTYKSIGRYRSSRMIGMELAEFYMKIKEFVQAENYLLDSIRMYQQESWNHLADGTMVQLAECQKLLKDPEKYLKTSCHIACSTHLSMNDRKKYFDEAMETIEQISGVVEMRASQAIFIENILLTHTSVSLNDDLTLEVKLSSNFPQPVTFETVQISIKKCSESEALEFLQQHQQQQQQQQQQCQQQQQQNPRQTLHRRQPSGTHITFDKMTNFQPVTKTLPSKIEFCTTTERNKGRLVSCGITCVKAHELLRRSDSASSAVSATGVYKEDYSYCFSQSDIILLPGQNSVTFTTQMKETGIFQLGQMSLVFKSLDLLKPMTTRNVYFKVVSKAPEFCLKPKLTEKFICGIEQEGVLSINSGSHSLAQTSTVSFATSPHFNITSGGEEKEVTIGPLSPSCVEDIPVNLYMSLKKETYASQISKISVTVDGWQTKLHKDVEFVLPFKATHKLYTTGKQKYFQILIHGNTSADFVLLDPKLETADFRDVKLVLMNRTDQIMSVNKHQSTSLLWQISSNVSILPVLDLTFSCLYTCHLDTNPQSHQFDYSCSIQDFQTQYILSYSVSSIEEDKSCSTGETAILDIKIKQVEDIDLMEGVRLAYNVKANGTVWAIGGKSSGVFTMKEGKHSIALDVVPMQSGYLHFPLVSLYKYMDQVDDHTTADVEEMDSDSDLAPLQLSPQKKRTVSQISTTSSSSSHFASHLVEFNQGQVYNESRSRQIHVYPCKTTGDIDVSLIK